LVVVITVLLSACTSPQQLTESKPENLPKNYNPSDSSFESSLPVWRDYFRDPYLQQYIEIALQKNLNLQIALQRIQQSSAVLRMAKGAMLPSVNAITSIGQTKFGEYTVDGIGNFDTNLSDNIGEDRRIPTHIPDYFLGFQSSWEADVWGKLKNRKRSALSRLMAGEKAYHLTRTMVVSAVAANYYQLVSFDNKLKIVQDNIRLQQEALALVVTQKQAGRATELAVKQFEAQLFNTQSLEGLVKQDIVLAENSLNLLLGRFPQPVPRGEIILNQSLPALLQVGIPSQLLTQRPDVREAELLLQSSRYDVRAARASFFPSLTVAGNIGLQAFSTDVLFSTPTSLAYTLLGGLTAPVFQRNALKAELQAANASQRAALLHYQQTILDSFQEVVTQTSRIKNLEDSYTQKDREVQTLLQGVAISNDLYFSGLATYLEVITAQRNVLQAELDVIDTRVSQFEASIQLYRSLGGGWQ
jgi:outer membrane protein, multidrug efflux system